MTDEEIEQAKFSCHTLRTCMSCPLSDVCIGCREYLELHDQLGAEKKLAETQLKELLSALYQRTEKPFTLERKDVLELAKDYGIKEEELK